MDDIKQRDAGEESVRLIRLSAKHNKALPETGKAIPQKIEALTGGHGRENGLVCVGKSGLMQIAKRISYDFDVGARNGYWKEI